MAINDNFSSTNKPSTVYEFRKQKEYTLEDLRNDDEFVKRAERFLESVNEGESVADLYQYFRGADFKLKDTFKVASQAKTFTDEQKQDYAYLRTKFDNANVGGFREQAQLGIDATQELLSDPLNWASALLIPWTGGTSVLGRLAGGEAAKQALKEATKVGLRQSLGKVVLNAPGQVLKGPLSTKQILAIASTEGMLYAGTNNYVNQSIDLSAGRRDERSYLETATAGGIGAVAAPLVVGGFKAAGQIPKWVNSVNEQRIAKIDHNENYKSTFVEGTASKLVEGTKTVGDVLKLTTLPLRPTTFLRKKAKNNELLQSLLKLIRYDAMEGFIAPALGKQEVLKPDYDALMRRLWGQKDEKLTKILRDNQLYTRQNRFTSKDRKNWMMNPGLSDTVNDDLAYFIRSGSSVKQVGDELVKLPDNIIKAGREIRKELDDVFNKATRAGLNPNRAANYFPRAWRIDAIKSNKKEFVEKIMKAEGASKDAAEDLWLRLTTEGTPESSTTSRLSTRLQSERLLTKIDDSEFGKFLNNDVEGVLRQYYAESAALITRTKLFGETVDDFVAKWIDPIKKSGLDLTDREELYLKTLYEIVTGQRGRINRNRRDFFDLIPTGKIGAGIHDTLTVTMQTSMLGLSTLTSFAEIGVPLLLGTESKVGAKAIRNAIIDSGKEWWGRQKQNFGIGDMNIDVRPATRQDLNAFMLSVNLAAEDRAVAIYGQAVGKTATKIQNFFFKTIGLHDWTRFVQLVGYDSGKNLIYKNLRTIADNPNMNKANKQRLTDELSELGINVQNGLNWLDRGGLHTDRFYMQDVRAAASRYTNEVVMNPTAASAQKPLVHSLATTKWIYGLMGFPTAFANGPLRKTIRNFTKDAKTFSSGGTRISTPRAVTGATFMASIGLLNYTLRTGGKNFEQLENGEITEYDMMERALQYSGLLGPAEYYVRYSKAKRYESKISAAIGSVVGPNLPDVYDYIKGFFDRGVVAETAYKRAPFIISLKSLHPEIYKQGLDYARELDKESPLSPEGAEEKEAEVIKSGKKFFATGGLIEGPEVPFTKENPADRVDPFTGEPYQEQMSRLGFNKGGLTDAEVLEMVADKPWFQRATQPGGKFLEDEYGRHTLLTTSSGADNKEYLYPRIREVDGELVDLKDEAFKEAIDRKDYIVFEGPNREQEATEVSKKISELIMPMRQLNKQQTEGRLGFSNGGEILKYIQQARGYEDIEFLKNYADDVKWQESRGAGPKTVQLNDGPARGSYQVEGSQGSSRNETILQRAKNFYEKYPDAPKSKEIQYALEQSGKDLDFSTLSEDTQDALFYMDAERGTLPLDELASGNLDNKTAWMNHWNQGPDQEVMEQKWDKAQQEKLILLQQQN
jgi:hypothetical protein